MCIFRFRNHPMDTQDATHDEHGDSDPLLAPPRPPAQSASNAVHAPTESPTSSPQKVQQTNLATYRPRLQDDNDRRSVAAFAEMRGRPLHRSRCPGDRRRLDSRYSGERLRRVALPEAVVNGSGQGARSRGREIHEHKGHGVELDEDIGEKEECGCG
jgi:hypothetical protein